MERLLQGKIQSVLAFLQTLLHAAVKGLLARSEGNILGLVAFVLVVLLECLLLIY